MKEVGRRGAFKLALGKRCKSLVKSFRLSEAPVLKRHVLPWGRIRVHRLAGDIFSSISKLFAKVYGRHIQLFGGIGQGPGAHPQVLRVVCKGAPDTKSCSVQSAKRVPSFRSRRAWGGGDSTMAQHSCRMGRPGTQFL